MRLWFSKVPDFPPVLGALLDVASVMFAVFAVIGVDLLDPPVTVRWLVLSLTGVVAFVFASLIRRWLAYSRSIPFISATQFRAQRKIVYSHSWTMYISMLATIIVPLHFVIRGNILPHGGLLPFGHESPGFVQTLLNSLPLLFMFGVLWWSPWKSARQAEFRRGADGKIEQIERSPDGTMRPVTDLSPLSSADTGAT